MTTSSCRKTKTGFKAYFLKACDVREDLATTKARLADVTKENRAGYIVRRQFLGYNKKGIVKKFGREPEVLGIKPVELRDELGDMFNCYLIEAEGDLPRKVEMFFTSTSSRTDYYMHPNTTLHLEQAKETFQHVTVETKAALVRKVNKAVNFGTIVAAAKALDDNDAEQRKLESDTGSDDDSQETVHGALLCEGRRRRGRELSRQGGSCRKSPSVCSGLQRQGSAIQCTCPSSFAAVPHKDRR